MGSVESLPRLFPLFSFFCLLVSSVSDFHPDTRGAVVDTFFCGGCCKQITLACACSVSAMLGLPLPTEHTVQALCCSARNRLRLALGCMHLPGLSHSGSALREPSEAQIRLGLHFVPFPGPSSSGVWRAQSLRLIAFPVPAAQFSGCTAGSPSQADDDCPEPQEVLAKKPACSLVGNASPGLRLPPSSPYGSGCLSPAGDGLQPAISVPSFVLFTVLALSYVRAFHVVAIPQSGLLAQVSSL